MCELLVHAEHVSHLSSAYTNVASRHILVRSDMAVELCHESLAEAHHLSVALSSWREVGTALCTTHRQRGKRVLECLFKCEKLQDSEIYRLMESYASLIRAYHVVVLHAVTHVGLHVALVVYPRHTEGDYSVRNAEALDKVGAVKLRMLVILFFYCCQYLTYGLDILRLVRESLFEVLNYICGYHKLFLFIGYTKKLITYLLLF